MSERSIETTRGSGLAVRLPGEERCADSWEHDPGDIFIPLDVMRAGRAPGDLHVVVMALQQTLAIDVKGLGGTVRGDIVGIADLEASPGFSIFLPWRKLFREDAGCASRNGVLR